jgi:hypothetical protein
MQTILKRIKQNYTSHYAVRFNQLFSCHPSEMVNISQILIFVFIFECFWILSNINCHCLKIDRDLQKTGNRHRDHLKKLSKVPFHFLLPKYNQKRKDPEGISSRWLVSVALVTVAINSVVTVLWFRGLLHQSDSVYRSNTNCQMCSFSIRTEFCTLVIGKKNVWVQV